MEGLCARYMIRESALMIHNISGVLDKKELLTAIKELPGCHDISEDEIRLIQLQFDPSGKGNIKSVIPASFMFKIAF